MHDHGSSNLPPQSNHSSLTIPLPLIALTGNPNSGKTTLFNSLTGSNQKVANYSGVTVELREGLVRSNGSQFRVIDLPGLYSLSAVSPDEEIARDLIVHGMGAEGRPDLIVQVVDGGRLERSLLLTMQLLEQELPLVIALNMYDEVQRRGLLIDPMRLEARLGVPVIPTVGSKGIGFNELMKAVQRVINEKRQSFFHVKFDPATEELLEKVAALGNGSGTTISRGIAIGLVTKEPSAVRGYGKEILTKISALIEDGEPDLGGSWTAAITHARFRSISEILTETSGPRTAGPAVSNKDELTGKLDRIFIHRVWGIPIFLAILFALFQVTFSVGAYPMDWIDAGIGWLGDVVKVNIPGLMGSVIADGFIAGIGMILVFLPNILILMMGIHLLEDSGYMARAAFLMDRLMRTMGLHGRAFIPMLMGFGCNVPAMMGVRVLESKRDRVLTLLLTPFMSCSARLPVYVMITAAFFPRNGGLVIFGLYTLGTLAAIGFGKLFSKTILRGQTAPFMLELPPYRWPTSRTTINLLKFTTKTFLRRIGWFTASIIIVIWFLSNFPRPEGTGAYSTYSKQTYIYQMGYFVEPVFKPLGFTLPMDISLLSGFVAKEVVVATMGVMFAGDSEATKETLVEQLRRQIPGTASAMAFLVFVLLYTPCITTIVTIQREAKKWYWTTFSIVYQTIFAWLAAFLTYRLMV